jgi:stress response protein YsnF
VRKEAFLREQVSIRKEVDRETVEASELLRHEELDIDKQDTSLLVGVGSPLENSDIVAKKS